MPNCGSQEVEEDNDKRTCTRPFVKPLVIDMPQDSITAQQDIYATAWCLSSSSAAMVITNVTNNLTLNTSETSSSSSQIGKSTGGSGIRVSLAMVLGPSAEATLCLVIICQ